MNQKSILSGGLSGVSAFKLSHILYVGMVFLPSLVTVLVLNGGLFFSLGQIVAIFLLVGVAAIVSSTFLAVYKESLFAFITLLIMTGLFVFLLINNYSPMVFGGQDPGYYTAFSRVLSGSLGSPFDSSSFELTRTSSLPSLVTENQMSEIQFYPMLPALMASIEWLFGNYSYPIWGAVSGLLVMALVIRSFQQSSIVFRLLTSGIWLFMPATIWFSRTPSSEIISVPILASALVLSSLGLNRLRQLMLIIFGLSLALMLARANPLLLVLVAIAGLYYSGVLAPTKGIIQRILYLIPPIALSVVLGVVVYWRHMPKFLEVIFIDIYGPHLGLLSRVLVFAALVGVLWLLLSKQLRSRLVLSVKNYNQTHMNYFFATVAALLILASTAIVLFTNEWGVYNPSVFGIGESLSQRLEKSPVVFLLTSFGLSLFLIKVRRNGFFGMLLIALSASLFFVFIRNPGVPITYFYERYWWSEVALILLFLIVASLTTDRVKSGFLKIASGILIFSSIVNFVVFDRTISETVEGVSEGDFKALVGEITESAQGEIFFSEKENIWWLSQIIVPLRYSFGVRATGFSENPPSAPPGSVLLSANPCEVGQQLEGQTLSVARLRKLSDLGIGSWGRYDTQVFICKMSRE